MAETRKLYDLNLWQSSS